MFEVIFDCETKKFFDEIDDYDPGKLGVSVVSVYTRMLDDKFNEIKGELASYWEDDFPKMWEHFQKADRIIGFNSIGFDVPALIPYSPVEFSKLKHFDILAMIKEASGKRMSLDALAKATLGQGKSDSGENAVKYWNAGDKESLEKLRKYCEADVVITKNIYDHAMKNGFLKYIDFWNEVREIKLDFSYPQSQGAENIQNSLF